MSDSTPSLNALHEMLFYTRRRVARMDLRLSAVETALGHAPPPPPAPFEEWWEDRRSCGVLSRRISKDAAYLAWDAGWCARGEADSDA